MIVPATRGIAAVVGFITTIMTCTTRPRLIADGHLGGTYHKQLLPNYGVFHEMRYFQRGTSSPVFVIAGVDCGVTICEDIWYPDGPARDQALAGAEVIININDSPVSPRKGLERERMIAQRATEQQQRCRVLREHDRRPGRACSSTDIASSTTNVER